MSLHPYEVMVIFDPDVDERVVPPALQKFCEPLEAAGGAVESTDVWGRRRLAYEINKKKEGIYAVLTLKASPSTVAELDRQLTLSEQVMRTKVIRPDER